MKKILLKEDTQNDDFFGKGSKLALALNTNCWPSLKNQKMVNDPVSGKKALQADNPNASTSTYKFLYFFDDGTTELRDTNTDKPQKTAKTTWNCNKMNDSALFNPTVAKIGNNIIEALKGSISDLKFRNELSGQDFFTYKPVDISAIAAGNSEEAKKMPANFGELFSALLSTDPVIKNTFIGLQGQGGFYVFLPQSGGVQKTVSQKTMKEKCIAKAVADGFEDNPGETPVGSNILAKDIRTYEGCSQATTGEYNVYKTVPDGEKLSTLLQLVNDAQTPPADPKLKPEKRKNACANLITTYYEALKDEEVIESGSFDKIKNAVASCGKDLPDFKWFMQGGKKRDLDAKWNWLTADKTGKRTLKKSSSGIEMQWNPTISSVTATKMKENFDKRLKNIIKENLIKTSKNKQKSLLQESKIVKNRFTILAEGVNHKTKKGQRIIAKRLFTEMAYLNTQGFDKKIINEQIWDFFKSLFGNTFSFEPVFDYFKEYLVKSLLDQFGVDTTGWIGNIVITTIGNIELSEIDRLTDCNYLSKILSKSIAEGAIRKLQGQSVGVGPLQDILRNALVDTLGETDLGNKIESFLGQLICPLISKVAGNMGSTMDSMKAKALGAA
jgi:hypothetical protein